MVLAKEARKMTIDDWEKIFQNQKEMDSGGVVARTEAEEHIKGIIAKTRIRILNFVSLHQRWEDDPLKNKEKDDDVVFVAGRWRVWNDDCFGCPDEDYEMGAGDLNNDYLLRQLSEKKWLYDPTCLMDTVAFALKLHFPEEPEEDITKRIKEYVKRCSPEFSLLLSTSIGSNRFLYLPSRMSDEKRTSFFSFLTDLDTSPVFI